MKSITLSFFAGVLAVAVSTCCNAWWPSGHLLAATIASQNLTPKTKEAVNELLEHPIQTPGPVTCIDGYPGYRLVAVATWADSIKTGNWGKTEKDKTAQSFYTASHFIDSILYCNRMNPETPVERVQEAIAESKGDNAVSVLRAAIVTLKTKSTSEQEKAFALRHLIHIAGDITQPLHTTDILYFPQSTSDTYIDTKGGGSILFITPESISVLFDDPIYSFFYKDIHSFWNDMGASDKFPQIPYLPGNITISKVQQGNLISQAGTLINDVKNSKYIENDDGKIINFTELKNSLNNDPDPMEWAADAYVQARDFGVKGLDFKPEDDLIYGLDGKLIVMIPKLPETYRELAKNIAEIQIYKAGIRLADMLNAIYDPEEAKPAYDKFVISLNGETLNELCPVNIQFMDKVYSV